MSYFILCLKKYVDFSGRARRSEYWFFTLFAYLVMIAFAALAAIALPAESMATLVSILSLAFLLPGLSVSIRRLHDIGKSGWWIFIGLVPLVGGIIFFIFTIMDSESGTNRYGPNPKEVAA